MTRALLLHGLGGAAADYDAVRALLPPAWSVEIPDLEGEFEDVVTYAADWLRQAGQGREAGPAVLVGHSMGGHLALIAARVVRDASTRLVLLAPGGIGPAPPAPLIYQAFGRDALVAMPSQAIEKLSRSRFADPRHPAADRLVAERLAMRGTQQMHDWAAQVDRFVGGVLRNWLGDAADTPGQLWLAHGTQDSMVPRAPIAALAAAHAHATLHAWDDAGHMLPHEVPERVAALIIEAAG